MSFDADLRRFCEELNAARTRNDARNILLEHDEFLARLSERSRGQALAAAQNIIASLPER